MAVDSSPFNKTDMVEIEKGYTYDASVMGIQLPDGKILLNYNKSTKYQTLLQIAKVLNAKVVTVKGTWSFTPHTEDI